jgi:benzoyl-CoA reductase/2-hydroxyglutaryl-CoA dehydratase subunit BcrC/BadD/HgdB
MRNFMEETRLAAHLRDRPAQLKKAKKDGVKIIGYFPGNYVPEEIIYASGAIPLCLIHGGSPRAADAGLSVMPQVICPFARAQIGERLLKENPYYNLMDMLVAPITCQHLKKVAELWEYENELEVFKLGVPHQYSNDFELEYYYDRLQALRDRLQSFTGNQITNDGLGRAITLYNQIRELLRKISLLRRATPPAISALEFIKLNHASFYADPVFMVDILESVYHELKSKQVSASRDTPRLLLLGPNIGLGDYTILEVIEATGGDIVVEELCEGVRYYWHDMENKGDLYRSLVRGYLLDRVPCAFMRHSAGKRLDFALGLIDDFNVSGVIWYELQCCETYDSEAYYFTEKMAERGIPVLVVESDYTTANTGQLRTRLQAFTEIVKGVV